MNSPGPDVTWFRLVVRGIGILLLAWGAPQVVQAITYTAVALLAPLAWGGSGQSLDWTYLGYVAGPIAQVLVGLYLLIGARSLIRYCCRGALGMCPACNYDVRHVPGATCPECGVALPGRTPAPAPPTP